MVRYFFIEVKIAQKEVERKYCPTEKMLQYCNKASMSKFKDMRSMVRKCSIDYNDQNGVGLHNVKGMVRPVQQASVSPQG